MKKITAYSGLYFSLAKQRGMTLIESVIAIVLLAIAMVSLTSFLFPNIKDSASPHYQTRAIALGQGFMSQILARNFDHNSDPDGGLIRCGEGAENSVQEFCTESLGAEESDVESYNDVDDYIACWYTSQATKDACPSGKVQRSLVDVFGDSVDTDFPNFRVEVNVFYDSDMDGTDDEEISELKRIEMTIYAGQYGRYPFVAYRGNY
ncbi:prepilin-type N-terminal cleavage/methylation domain-containing protein [Vibrio cyclitrophicus]|uniref:type IV pilus modification PilV family protein n=1 Tax=Vibrio cyclitrophicus TaxID=47951 RepID=UPI000C84D8B1|nr:prepilin-type N-terminal cleavage/methylation domain-containing protein [Vibrio cyclitrophicus]PMF24704.1 MSHA biogenesis protein MshD [Vibrio cyclitrophicus]